MQTDAKRSRIDYQAIANQMQKNGYAMPTRLHNECKAMAVRCQAYREANAKRQQNKRFKEVDIDWNSIVDRFLIDFKAFAKRSQCNS
jgi:hypothetical protein